MKKLMGMLAGVFCAAFLAVMVTKPIEAEAAGRRVEVKYNVDNWYMNISTQGYWQNMSLTDATLEDGDILVIDASLASSQQKLTIDTSRKLATIAVVGENAYVVVNASSKVGEVYPANGATLIYSGDAGKVIANAGAVTQINGNVDTLEATYVTGKVPVFAVTGTVGTLKANMTDGKITTDLAYDFAPGTVHAYEDGIVRVEEGTLKGSPAAAETKPAGNTKKELDEVPKTGKGVSTSLLFFGLSFALAVAAVSIKKRESVKQ